MEQSIKHSVELLDDLNLDFEGNVEDLEEPRAVLPNSSNKNRTAKTVF